MYSETGSGDDSRCPKCGIGDQAFNGRWCSRAKGGCGHVIHQNAADIRKPGPQRLNSNGERVRRLLGPSE